MKLFEYLIGGKKTGMWKRLVRITFNEVNKGDTLYLWNFSKKTGGLARKITWEVTSIGKNRATFNPRGNVIDCRILTTLPEEKLNRLYSVSPDIPSRDYDKDHHIWNTGKFNNIITTFDDEKRVEELLMEEK